MSMKKLWHGAQIIKIAYERFFDENYTYRASALAFTTILALVPLLFVIVFFATMFPLTDIIALGESYILKNFVPTSAAAIERYFQGFIVQAAHLPMFSILFLFITTILLVHTIEETLNDIWCVPRRERTEKAIALFLHWLTFLLLPFLIGLSVFLSTYFFSLKWIVSSTELLGITHLLLSCLPILINTLVFTLLYVIVPNAHIKWRNGFVGGFIAALLFEVARIGFALYVQQFPSYALIYGAFAIIPIFLLWLYIFWFIILFSALITHAAVSHGDKHVHYKLFK